MTGESRTGRFVEIDIYDPASAGADHRDSMGYASQDLKDALSFGSDFPNAADLQEDHNLGRLKTTSADGDHDVIYSYGASSMTIWDVSGNIAFDSGSQLAKLLAKESPETFNSQGLLDSFDNRSDDKGTEKVVLRYK